MSGLHEKEKIYGTEEQWNQAKRFFEENPEKTWKKISVDNNTEDVKEVTEADRSEFLSKLKLSDRRGVGKLRNEAANLDKTMEELIKEKILQEKNSSKTKEQILFLKIDGKIYINTQDAPIIGKGSFGDVKGLYLEGDANPSMVLKSQATDKLNKNEIEAMKALGALKVQINDATPGTTFTVEPYYGGNTANILLPGLKPMTYSEVPISDSAAKIQEEIKLFQMFAKKCYNAGISGKDFEDFILSLGVDYESNQKYPVIQEFLKDYVGAVLKSNAASVETALDFERTEQYLTEQTLEYLQNNDNKLKLQELLKKTSFSKEERRRAVLNVAQELQHIHLTTGMCHNDLKLANMMVKADLTVKIIDFGSCVKIGTTGRYQGTLTISAPEVLQGLNQVELDKVSVRGGYQTLQEAFDKNKVSLVEIKPDNSKFSEKSDVYSLGVFAEMCGLTSGEINPAIKINPEDRCTLNQFIAKLKSCMKQVSVAPPVEFSAKASFNNEEKCKKQLERLSTEVNNIIHKIVTIGVVDVQKNLAALEELKNTTIVLLPQLSRQPGLANIATQIKDDIYNAQLYLLVPDLQTSAAWFLQKQQEFKKSSRSPFKKDK